MGAHKSSLAQKAEWLAARPEICAAWPNHPWTDKAVLAAMRKDGLISEGAHDYDIGDLGKPIGEARALIRSRNRSGHNEWK